MRGAVIVLLVAFAGVEANAQWVKYPNPGTPRTADGKPNLSPPPPRASNGRPIYTDGRKHVADPSPSWLGYSVGTWQGDTLVVDTVGFNGKSWLDVIGHPQSEAAHIVERYHRRDFGHMDIEMTIDDPTWYTKPFTVKVTHLLKPDTDILEYFCSENEKDRPRMGVK
jgi:hypothetical protein